MWVQTLFPFSRKDSDPNSLLNRYRDWIHVRESSPALVKGDIQDFQTGDSRILGYTRNFKNDSVLVLNNLSGETVTVNVDKQDFKSDAALFSAFATNTINKGHQKMEITMPAYSSIFLK
ncbi:alpha-glucosidase C-terminal domain-containing protein [Sporolactobacillus putidus]|uniref:Alpha-amylase SusG-like C-terminal domain-containing protein n=1 Tax=Sporolactobacillus putidus TaxID=492735 RepID=A0A917VZ52_9BACL|nr:alpha-glucosidase C-terminal domain-containing protein [Sporolactobacillus putidus]GGL41699.1 hypothetical protein GCM10007968_02000 [Sporolactobacillus putidus]